MTFETGIFLRVLQICKIHKLPLKFVIEDNGLSTNTPTNKVWVKKSKKTKDVIL